MIEGVNVRSDIPKWLVKQGYRVGAEIGVYKGEYTEMFLKEGLTMYAVDPYIPYNEAPSAEAQELLYQQTAEFLKQYPNCTLIRKTSLEAVKDFEDESLDFVYIDGDHSFQSCLEDITEWAKKVRKGGVVMGHDYKGHSSRYVYPAVNYYVKEHGIKELHVIARRGYMVRSGDKHASFLWVKE
jgi:Methyltransferase domain